MPVGSMPYSAGSTTVTSSAAAASAASSVARTSCAEVGVAVGADGSAALMPWRG